MRRWQVRGIRRAAVSGVAVLLLAGCTSTDGPPPQPPPTKGPDKPMTFGTFGAEDEIAAFQGVTDSFNALTEGADVELASYPDNRALVKALEEGDVPDVFLVSRDDLAWLLEEDLTQPVDMLLDERGVDFGDRYSRDGLQAFSAEDRLQCMPYGISPRVMFYNTEMVDFDKMTARGLLAPVPSPVEERARSQSWSFEEFSAAAEFAARPKRKTRGVYVEPNLDSLAPFIYSGGGQLFDDAAAPTSLAFNEGDTQDALERSLPLLRSPLVTPSRRELERRTPLQMFEDGKLAMIEGYRRLVPQLRQVQGLEFDVMPMPILDGAGTVGEVTGLCMSADTLAPAAAADLMVKLTSTPAVQRVVHAGYTVPANLEVALSHEFLQPGRLPAHAGVFNSSVRSIVFHPLLTTWDELEAAVAPGLQRLLNEPLLDDLDGLTQEIDDESRLVLDPESASPSESESAEE